VEYTGLLLVHTLVRSLYNSNPVSMLTLLLSLATCGCGPRGVEGGANPVLLEAFLRAKEAVLDSKLQTGWTLERAGIVGAVDT
jgi:hypothetical protein